MKRRALFSALGALPAVPLAAAAAMTREETVDVSLPYRVWPNGAVEFLDPDGGVIFRVEPAGNDRPPTGTHIRPVIEELYDRTQSRVVLPRPPD